MRRRRRRPRAACVAERLEAPLDPDRLADEAAEQDPAEHVERRRVDVSSRPTPARGRRRSRASPCPGPASTRCWKRSGSRGPTSGPDQRAGQDGADVDERVPAIGRQPRENGQSMAAPTSSSSPSAPPPGCARPTTRSPGALRRGRRVASLIARVTRRARAAHVGAHRPRLGACRRGARRERRCASTPARGRLLDDDRRAALAAAGRDPLRRPGGRQPPGPPRRSGSARSSAGGSRPRRCSCRGARAGWPRRPHATPTRWSSRSRSSRSGTAGRARPRRRHLRRQPGEEGPRPRPRRLGAARREGEELVVAGRRRTRRATASATRACSRRPSTARCSGARACSSPPRAARTTGSPSSRRSPTAARSSRRRRPAPTRRSRSRAALDPRLVGDDLAAAIRTALDDPSPDYAERARAALAPWRRRRSTRSCASSCCPHSSVSAAGAAPTSAPATLPSSPRPRARP